MDNPQVRDDGFIENENGSRRSDRTGKGRYDLISSIALEELAKVYEEGAAHKGDRNWETGFELSRALDSALRHLNQFKKGMRDERHLGQSCWNIFCMIHFIDQMEKGLMDKKFDDLPKYV